MFIQYMCVCVCVYCVYVSALMYWNDGLFSWLYTHTHTHTDTDRHTHTHTHTHTQTHTHPHITERVLEHRQTYLPIPEKPGVILKTSRKKALQAREREN